MPYVFLHSYLPELASSETRSVIIFSTDNEFGLPIGEYTFIELFCDECDCKRGMFYVVRDGSKEPVAVIRWGWGSKQFYEKWLSYKDDKLIKEMMEVGLNELSPQSPIANNVLRMFNKILFKDKKYLERVQNHYEIVRRKIKKTKE